MSYVRLHPPGTVFHGRHVGGVFLEATPLLERLRPTSLRPSGTVAL